MSFEITHAHLWRAQWGGLCRLGRSLGLRVGAGPEADRRGPLVEAVMRRIGETQLEWWAGRYLG